MTEFPPTATGATEHAHPFAVRHARLLRWLLAGPLALILAILLMACLPFALPAGRGGIDHLVLPVIFFPLIWAMLVILPVATARLVGLIRIYLLLLAICVAIVALKLLV